MSRSVISCKADFGEPVSESQKTYTILSTIMTYSIKICNGVTQCRLRLFGDILSVVILQYINRFAKVHDSSEYIAFVSHFRIESHSKILERIREFVFHLFFYLQYVLLVFRYLHHISLAFDIITIINAFRVAAALFLGPYFIISLSSQTSII